MEDRHTGKQTDRSVPSRQTDSLTGGHLTDRHTAVRQKGKQADGWAPFRQQADRHTEIQSDRQTVKQAVRHTDWNRPDRQPGEKRQTER